ncbi:hypothetical protein SeLEV6574_g00888 [Synchytrium endobioticum]|nr:hypothetical protein SeLEV6574_g00888 [Synchytrium endobioticum]
MQPPSRVQFLVDLQPTGDAVFRLAASAIVDFARILFDLFRPDECSLGCRIFMDEQVRNVITFKDSDQVLEKIARIKVVKASQPATDFSAALSSTVGLLERHDELEEGEAVETDKPKRLVLVLLGRSPQDAAITTDTLITLVTNVYRNVTNRDGIATNVDVLCMALHGDQVSHQPIMKDVHISIHYIPTEHIVVALEHYTQLVLGLMKLRVSNIPTKTKDTKASQKNDMVAYFRPRKPIKLNGKLLGNLWVQSPALTDMTLHVTFGKWQTSATEYHTTSRLRITALRSDDAKDHESQVTRLVLKRLRSEDKIVELRGNVQKSLSTPIPQYILRLMAGSVFLLKVSEQLQGLSLVGLQRVRSVLASAPSQIPLPPPISFSNATPPKNFVSTTPLKYLSHSTISLLPPEIDASTFTSVASIQTDVLTRYLPISAPSVLFDDTEIDIVNNLQPLKTAIYENKVDVSFVVKCRDTWKLMGIAWSDPDILFPDDGKTTNGSRNQRKKISMLFNEVLVFLERHRSTSEFHEQLYSEAHKSLSSKMDAPFAGKSKKAPTASKALTGVPMKREESTGSGCSKREGSAGPREASTVHMTREALIEAALAESERQASMTYRERQDLITPNPTQLDVPLPMSQQRGPGFIGRGGPPQPMTILPSYLIVRPPMQTPQQSDARARQVWGKEGGRGWLYWANLEDKRRRDLKRRFTSLKEREFVGANGMNWKSGMDQYGDGAGMNSRKGPKRFKDGGGGGGGGGGANKSGNVDGVVDYVLYE